ncbi:hypothetical protein DL95DRAFT_450218 [Leptodontidium sp. 2 PMI_412]|nr:hypothetical protein DL95DRAFT_450218 [Leptodontidium sp. 2 PMI_412]
MGKDVQLEDGKSGHLTTPRGVDAHDSMVSLRASGEQHRTVSREKLCCAVLCLSTTRRRRPQTFFRIPFLFPPTRLARGKKATILISSTIVILAALWQVVLRDALFITFSIGRTHQRIEEFPYQCRRLTSPPLDSCEDMVLDEEGRTLFAACSSISSRRAWGPGGDKYDISARDFNDRVSVLDIDEPGPDGLYGLRKLEITGTYVSTGGREIDVNGIAMEAASTPNGLLATGDGGVYVTNDHDSKTGEFRFLEMIFGGGSVAYRTLENATSLHLPDSNSPEYIGYFGSEKGMQVSDPTSCVLVTSS